MKTLLALFVTVVAPVSTQAGALVLDADTTVALALAASPLTAATAARVVEADANVAAADAVRLPVVDIEAGVAHRSSVPEMTLPASAAGLSGFVLFPDIRNVARTGLVISQPLWSGGAIAGTRSATRHERSAVAAEADRTAADLSLRARAAYWAAVAADASLETARAEGHRAERLVHDAKNLRAAGMAVRADELGATARLAAARVRTVEAEAALASRLAELRSLLGLPAARDLKLRDGGDRLPAQPGALDALIAEAVSSRPEMTAMAARREALVSRAAAAGAPIRPQVALTGRWDLGRPNDRYLPPADEWNTSWSLGLVAGWRLFDGNRTRAQVAAIDAERSALEAERLELERTVTLDVENARRDLVTKLAATAAATDAVTAATAREADSRERYGEGLATVLEVLDAQTELAQAERLLVHSRTGAWLAEANLRRAVGQ